MRLASSPEKKGTRNTVISLLFRFFFTRDLLIDAEWTVLLISSRMQRNPKH